MDSLPQIVVGTYEEFILGYSPRPENENSSKFKLSQTFASHSHLASIRCVAVHNHLMASSGADENINIYDMIAMEVSSVINYHNATVTCLEFTPDGSHLVTANQNGDIAIFRCRDWRLVKLWKEAHKHANGVTSISIHPTGTILLTTGADNIVRFWNLIKGRQAYATNFSKKCSVGNSLNFGKWSKKGNYYAVCIGNKLEIYKTETAALIYEIKTDGRIICCEFIKKNLICVAKENGSVEIHSVVKKKLLLTSQPHKNRVKSLASFNVQTYKNDKNVDKSYLVSVDSMGIIKLWYLKKQGLKCSLLLRGEADCGCRITCLAVVILNNLKKEVNDNKKSINLNDVTTKIATETEIEEVKIEERNSEINILKHKINNGISDKCIKKKKMKNGLNDSKEIKSVKNKKLISLTGKKSTKI